MTGGIDSAVMPNISISAPSRERSSPPQSVCTSHHSRSDGALRTKVPLARNRSMRPSASIWSRAWRMVARATPYSAASSSTVGMRRSGPHTPASIRRRNSVASWM